MPRIVLSDQGQYSILKDPSGPVPAGWRVVQSMDDDEACAAYLRKTWTDPFLRSAPARRSEQTLHPLPVTLSEGVTCPYSNKAPTARIFVFPHAGAGPSAYHGFAKAFRQTGTEILIVAYPGREIRYRTPPARSMEALLAEFDEHLAPLLELGRFAFYGHSLGALAAFEYARRLAATRRSLPDFLVLTGRHAPSITGLDMPVDPLTDDEFIEAVGRRYNAIPREVLDTPELLQLLLPALRADFKLVAGHTYRPAPRLRIPTLLINGTEDPWISNETLGPWDQDVSVAQQHWLPGDHFFLRNNLEPVQKIVLKFFSELTSL